MKAKLQLLVMMMFVTAFTLSACSDNNDDHDNIVVPDAVAKALMQKYPSATGVDWEQKGIYFVADFWLDGKEANVWYDANANWQMTQLDIFWNNIPPAVQTAFNNGEYADWVQDDYYLLEYPLNPMQFVIEVKQGNTKYQLFYSEDGGLINKLNVTGKDDTIYPPV